MEKYQVHAWLEYFGVLFFWLGWNPGYLIGTLKGSKSLVCEEANLGLSILLPLPSGLGSATIHLCFLSTLPWLLVCRGALLVLGLDSTLFTLSAILVRLRLHFQDQLAVYFRLVSKVLIIWVRSEICLATPSNIAFKQFLFFSLITGLSLALAAWLPLQLGH